MRGPVRVLRPYLVRQWRALAVAGLSTVVVTAADLAQPFPLKLIIDRLFEEHPNGAFDLSRGELMLVGAVAGLVLLIAVTDALAQYWTDVSLQRAGERIVHDLRVGLYAQLQRLSLTFHERQHAGDLSTRVTGDVNSIGDLFSGTLGTIVQSALLLVGMVVVALVLDPVVALGAFCVTPVLAIVTFRFRRRLGTLSREQRRKEGEIASMATETFNAVRVVKAFGSEDFEHGRLERKSDERREFGIESARLEGRYSGTVDVIGAIGTAVVLVVGVIRVAGGHLSPGDLVVVTSYARKAYRPLRAIARQASKVSKTMARAERVADILASDEVLVDRPGAHSAGRSHGEIALEGVSFSYAADRPALRELSLDVWPGEKVAVVGPSGAGKSTLAALIARFYDPAAGAVRLDGHDLRDCSLSWLRSQVAMVLQDTILFTGTVTENIAYGLDVTTDRVTAAAKAAGAHSFITQLPEGYDTALGPRGLSLSGGQRQRLAIARTLLRDPPILILDEPTTGLDAESEAQVLRGLEVLMRGRTTVLITHSLALAGRADRVVVIEDGRAVQHGTPAELVEQPGVFRRLAAEQGLAPPSARAATGVVDAALPQLGTVLDADAMADVLQRSAPADAQIDVRIRRVRYRPQSSVCVHYDVALDGTWHEAVAFARPGSDLGAKARKADSTALARRVDGRSPVPFPLAYEVDLDLLVQWLPLDLWLPLLAEPTSELKYLVRAAGARAPQAPDVKVLNYRPRRRVVLHVGRYVLKAYAKRADFDRADAALQAAVLLGGIARPMWDGTVPERLLTVQRWLPGRRPARPGDMAGPAGALLAALHATPRALLDGVPTTSALDHLAGASATCARLTALVPWLGGRLDMLLGTLELAAPADLGAVATHGDYHAGQLLVHEGALALVDFDGLAMAPAATDVATYAAHVVRGDDGDIERALDVLDAVIDGYGDRPDGLAWFLAVAILQRADLPFRSLDERWSERVEAMVDAAEAVLSA